MTGNNALTLLQGIDQLLDSPEKWIKGHLARLPNGKNTVSSDPEATCFCMLGAVTRVLYKTDGMDYNDYLIARSRLRASLPDRFETVPEFNDDPETTFDNVKEVIRRAIAREQAQLLPS